MLTGTLLTHSDSEGRSAGQSRAHASVLRPGQRLPQRPGQRKDDLSGVPVTAGIPRGRRRAYILAEIPHRRDVLRESLAFERNEAEHPGVSAPGRGFRGAPIAGGGGVPALALKPENVAASPPCTVLSRPQTTVGSVPVSSIRSDRGGGEARRHACGGKGHLGSCTSSCWACLGADEANGGVKARFRRPGKPGYSVRVYSGSQEPIKGISRQSRGHPVHRHLGMSTRLQASGRC